MKHVLLTTSSFVSSILLVVFLSCEEKIVSPVLFDEDMILIQARGKSFQMGSYEGSKFKKPVYTVKFTYDFYISKTEVTQREYEELMGENPSEFKGDSLPVETVSWWDAIKYCNTKSRKDGLTPCYDDTTGECNFKANGYRLPTDAEWEYAARGGPKSKGYEYSGSNTIDDVAWYRDNSERQTHPVGEKGPNELGLYDMSGNVLEWCNDWYDKEYYEQCKERGSVQNPTGPNRGVDRVLRGGTSWFLIAGSCLSANRFSGRPGNRDFNFGIRLARGHIEADSDTTVEIVDDNEGPVITLIKPEKDSTKVSESSVNVTVNCTDSSGVRLVMYTFKGKSQAANKGSDDNYSAEVAGFVVGENLLTITALDGSSNENRSKKCVTIIYYTTDMVLINSKGKSYQMGSNNVGSDEKPVHTVKFTYDFYMGRSEVTQREYEELMGENPSYFKGDNLPVERVSWWDAIKYCNAKSRRDGLTPCYNERTGECNFKSNGYRLPTEAEWEYAARGGSKSKGYEYSGSNTIDDVAWYRDNSKRRTHPVGEKEPNELGLYDMIGNVYEWCNDWFDRKYYEQCKERGTVLNPTGPKTGGGRVLRGGCWGYNSYKCRSAFRSRLDPVNRYSDIGFRLARGQIEKGQE